VAAGCQVHLVDGTYELFRHHFGTPEAERDGFAAVRGVLGSVLTLLEEGATHVGVATDHVVESFRNDLWPGYKTSEGMPPELLAQFEPLEEALGALGVVVWPMVDLEADDALASAAAVAAADPAVVQVRILTPDKDLAQCVVGERVVQVNRRTGEVSGAGEVVERFGVAPSSIPDWLALVGDSADGFPGLAGWGKTSASRVLAVHPHLEDIPAESADWGVSVRGAGRLAATLVAERERALLFRHLATLVVDPPVIEGVEQLRWAGPTPRLDALAGRLRAPGLVARARSVAARRGPG